MIIKRNNNQCYYVYDIIRLFLASNMLSNKINGANVIVQKKRIFDAIAASSIISNSTGVETSKAATTWTVHDLMNFIENKQLMSCTEEEAQMIIEV